MAKQKSSKAGGPKTKSRRRGYRGYGSPLGRGENFGGSIHWGRGFTGVGFPGEQGPSVLPKADVLPEEKSRKSPPRKK